MKTGIELKKYDVLKKRQGNNSRVCRGAAADFLYRTEKSKYNEKTDIKY